VTDSEHILNFDFTGTLKLQWTEDSLKKKTFEIAGVSYVTNYLVTW